MFARIKRNGPRAYLVVVENQREPVVSESAFGPVKNPSNTVHRQREIARLGRIDHLATGDQNRLVQKLSALLADVRAPRPQR